MPKYEIKVKETRQFDVYYYVNADNREKALERFYDGEEDDFEEDIFMPVDDEVVYCKEVE